MEFMNSPLFDPKKNSERWSDLTSVEPQATDVAPVGSETPEDKVNALQAAEVPTAQEQQRRFESTMSRVDNGGYGAFTKNVFKPNWETLVQDETSLFFKDTLSMVGNQLFGTNFKTDREMEARAKYDAEFERLKDPAWVQNSKKWEPASVNDVEPLAIEFPAHAEKIGYWINRGESREDIRRALDTYRNNLSVDHNPAEVNQILGVTPDSYKALYQYVDQKSLVDWTGLYKDKYDAAGVKDRVEGARLYGLPPDAFLRNDALYQEKIVKAGINPNQTLWGSVFDPMKSQPLQRKLNTLIMSIGPEGPTPEQVSQIKDLRAEIGAFSEASNATWLQKNVRGAMDLGVQYGYQAWDFFTDPATAAMVAAGTAAGSLVAGPAGGLIGAGGGLGSAAVAAIGAAATQSAFKSSYKAESTQNYIEMLDSGVSPESAWWYSRVAGAVGASIELASFGNLLPYLPVARGLAKPSQVMKRLTSAAKYSPADNILLAIARGAAAVNYEGIEEGAQEFTRIFSAGMARRADGVGSFLPFSETVQRVGDAWASMWYGFGAFAYGIGRDAGNSFRSAQALRAEAQMYAHAMGLNVDQFINMVQNQNNQNQAIAGQSFLNRFDYDAYIYGQNGPVYVNDVDRTAMRGGELYTATDETPESVGAKNGKLKIDLNGNIFIEEGAVYRYGRPVDETAGTEQDTQDAADVSDASDAQDSGDEVGKVYIPKRVFDTLNQEQDDGTGNDGEIGLARLLDGVQFEEVGDEVSMSIDDYNKMSNEFIQATQDVVRVGALGKSMEEHVARASYSIPRKVQRIFSDTERGKQTQAVISTLETDLRGAGFSKTQSQYWSRIAGTMLFNLSEMLHIPVDTLRQFALHRMDYADWLTAQKRKNAGAQTNPYEIDDEAIAARIAESGFTGFPVQDSTQNDAQLAYENAILSGRTPEEAEAAVRAIPRFKDFVPKGTPQVLEQQAISSAGTSIKQVAAAFKKIPFAEGTVNLDIGGGRFDEGTEYLAGLGVTNLVYDPYNRTTEHNKSVLASIGQKKPDTVTVNNVLNVIAEADERENVIRMAAMSVYDGGTVYFSVYEGTKANRGKPGVSKTVGGTATQFQNNQPTSFYVPEIQKYFDNVTMKNGIISATGPKGETQTLNQDSIITGHVSVEENMSRANPNANIQQTPGFLDSVMNFFETANASSPYHEFAHHLFNILASVRGLEGIDPDLVKRMDVLFDEMGITVDEYLESANVPKDHPLKKKAAAAQEKFAKSFEVYMYTGKAPTRELQGVFNKIRALLIQVYEDIQTSLGVTLSEETKEFFDLLLATPEDIAENKSVAERASEYGVLNKRIKEVQAQGRTMDTIGDRRLVDVLRDTPVNTDDLLDVVGDSRMEMLPVGMDDPESQYTVAQAAADLGFGSTDEFVQALIDEHTAYLDTINSAQEAYQNIGTRRSDIAKWLRDNAAKISYEWVKERYGPHDAPAFLKRMGPLYFKKGGGSPLDELAQEIGMTGLFGEIDGADQLFEILMSRAEQEAVAVEKQVDNALYEEGMKEGAAQADSEYRGMVREFRALQKQLAGVDKKVAAQIKKAQNQLIKKMRKMEKDAEVLAFKVAARDLEIRGMEKEARQDYGVIRGQADTIDAQNKRAMDTAWRLINAVVGNDASPAGSLAQRKTSDALLKAMAGNIKGAVGDALSAIEAVDKERGKEQDALIAARLESATKSQKLVDLRVKEAQRREDTKNKAVNKVKMLMEKRAVAKAIKDETNAIVRYINKVAKAKDVIWEDHVKMNDLLKKYDLKRRSQRTIDMRAEVAAYMEDPANRQAVSSQMDDINGRLAMEITNEERAALHTERAKLKKYTKMDMDALTATTLGEMSWEDLHELQKDFQTLEQHGKQKYQEWLNAQTQRRNDLKTRAWETIKKKAAYTVGVRKGETATGKQYTGKSAAAQKVRDEHHAYTLDRHRFFHWIDGFMKGVFSEMFGSEWDRRDGEKNRHINERVDFVKGELRKLGLSIFGFSKKIPGLNAGGVEWTYDQAMHIFIGMKNSYNRNAILYGTFKDFTDKNYDQRMAMVNEIIAALPEKYKQAAIIIPTDFANNGPRINETLIETMNYGFNFENWYVPILRNEVYKDGNVVLDAQETLAVQNADEAAAMIAKQNDGFVIDRRDITPEHQASIQLGLFATWNSSMRKQEHTAAFSGYVQDVASVLHSQDPNHPARSMGRAIVERFGKTAWNATISQANVMIRDSAKLIESDASKIFDWFANNLAVAALAYSLGSTIKQVVALPRYMGYAGASPLIFSLAKYASNPWAFMRNAFEIDPSLRERSGDVAFDSLKNDTRWHLRASFWMMGKMDQTIAAIGEMGVYDACQNKGMSHEASLAEARRATAMTQNATTAKDKAYLWKQGAAVRSFMMFTGDAAKRWNMSTYDFMHGIAAEAVSPVQSWFYNNLAYTMETALYFAMSNGLPSGDEEEAEEEWLKKCFLLSWANDIPLLGPLAAGIIDEIGLVEVAYNRAPSTALSSSVERALQLGKKVKTAGKEYMNGGDMTDLFKGAWYVAEAVSFVGGKRVRFPSQMIKRMINAGSAAKQGEVYDAVLHFLLNQPLDKTTRRTL